MKVLVVDDNPDTVATLKFLIELGGFEVEACLRARDCIRAQAHDPADVLITNIFMPDMEGLQVIHEFRARWPRTRIIAISGGGAFVHGDYLPVAQGLGADLAFRKPFDPQALLHAVEDLARHRQADSG